MDASTRAAIIARADQDQAWEGLVDWFGEQPHQGLGQLARDLDAWIEESPDEPIPRDEFAGLCRLARTAYIEVLLRIAEKAAHAGPESEAA